MRKADLNLLVVFDAIMREGSMTQAAEQLAMTQPAVSNAVARMRVVWNDPLFVKRGRGILPTPRAQEMWDRIRLHMDDLREMANPEPFDAASARRSFRIGTNDLCAGMTWRALRRLAELHAPGIDFHSVPNSKATVEELLFNAEVDVVLGCAAPAASARLRERALSESHYVCAMRPDHPLASESLSLDSFAAAEHLRVSPTGDATGMIDEILKTRGRSRRVAMTVNHYAQVAPLLRETSLISTVPFEAVAESVQRDELRAVRLPIRIRPIKLSLLWHERSDRDAGQRWLRNQLASVIAESNRCHPVPEGIRATRPGMKDEPDTTIKVSAPFA